MVSGYVSSVEPVPGGVHVTLSGLLPQNAVAFHARVWFSHQVMRGDRPVVGDLMAVKGDVAFCPVSDDGLRARLLLRAHQFRRLTPLSSEVVYGTYPTHLGRSEGYFLKDAHNTVLISLDTLEELSREELPRIGLVVSTKLLQLDAVVNFVREIPSFLRALDGQCEVSLEAVLTSDRLPDGHPVGYLVSRQATLVGSIDADFNEPDAIDACDAADASNLMLS
jgi:hypothetical protein